MYLSDAQEIKVFFSLRSLDNKDRDLFFNQRKVLFKIFTFYVKVFEVNYKAQIKMIDIS